MTEDQTNGNQAGQEGAQGGQQQQEDFNFETWLASQDEQVKKGYEEYVSGLKATVKATRTERDDLAKQLKDAASKAGKDTELRTQLLQIGERLEAAEARASFFEDASRPEIGCRNPKVAYALAVSEELFDRKGVPDWAAIKASAPELFGTKGAGAGHAGSGTGSEMSNDDMNARIRRAAGRI